MDTSKVIEDILAHHGVKGQKWGIISRRREISRAARAGAAKQRKKEGQGPFGGHGLTPKSIKANIRVAKASSAAGKAKKAELKEAKKSSKFEKEVTSQKFKANLHNDTVNIMNNYEIPKINAKYSKELANGSLQDPYHPATKKYYDDIMNAYVKEANKHISTYTDVTGSKRLVATRRVPTKDNPFAFDINVKDIEHADTTIYTVKAVLDSNGLVTNFELVDNSLTQGALAVEDILAHHGVKGMRWGVRSRSSRPQGVTVKDKGRKLKTSGGKGHPATESAVRARKIGQVGKKSGLKALTDEELNTYARRIQLEQNVARLQYNEKSRGGKFVDSFLGRQGSQLANKAAQEGSAKAGRSAVNAATRKSARVARLAALAAA